MCEILTSGRRDSKKPLLLTRNYCLDVSVHLSARKLTSRLFSVWNALFVCSLYRSFMPVRILRHAYSSALAIGISVISLSSK